MYQWRVACLPLPACLPARARHPARRKACVPIDSRCTLHLYRRTHTIAHTLESRRAHFLWPPGWWPHTHTQLHNLLLCCIKVAQAPKPSPCLPLNAPLSLQRCYWPGLY